MLNIIRMDFARMMRSKSQYILWIVMAGLLILTTATMGSEFRDPKASAENWATIQDQAGESAENLGPNRVRRQRFMTCSMGMSKARWRPFLW